MTFKQVAPGILVNEKSDIKISISHPDPCWIIQNSDKTMTIGDENSIFIFSSEQKVIDFMSDNLKENYLTESYTWDDLVDNFNKYFQHALLDHTGKTGFYQNIPLRKGI